MQRLNVNPATLAMALASLTGTPEEVNYFAAQLTRSCATELTLYQSTPPPNAPPEVVQAAAAGKSEWGDMLHPFVVAQVLVDLCERTGQPIPDNLFVYADNDWVPLHNVQPNAPARTPVAPPAPAVTPAQLASPAPVSLERVEVMGATIIHATDPQPQQAVPMPQVPLQVTNIPEPPELIEDAVIVPPTVQTAAVTPAPAPAPAPQAATVGADGIVRGEFGLPVPEMAAPKGKSPFDTDPGYKVPGSAPDRVVRDWITLSEGLFAVPAATLVKGDGKGTAQRTRAYMALLLLVDQALASVPEDTTPVGFLRHHIAHLRYNASQSAAGPSMLAAEQYLFKAREQ